MRLSGRDKHHIMKAIAGNPGKTSSFRANALNSRGIVGAGTPGGSRGLSWWS